MVNKVAVLLVGGVVLVGVVVIGGVAALVLGNGGAAGSGTPTAVDATPLPEPDTSTPTGTPVPAVTGTATATRTATATGTATATMTGTATATPYSTVAPSEFNATRIEMLVERFVNDRREALGLDPLERNGTTPFSVSQMARDHSEAMAGIGSVAHVVNGSSSTDRYHEYSLYTTCQWELPGGEGFARPDSNGITGSENGFEVVTRTIAGRPYESDLTGTSRLNANDREVARAIVQRWWNETGGAGSDQLYYRDRLTLENARYVGVGVEVTQYGEVYATANLC